MVNIPWPSFNDTQNPCPDRLLQEFQSALLLDFSNVLVFEDFYPRYLIQRGLF